MNENQASGVEELTAVQCWQLLASTSVGRLAVIVDGHPDIFPLNYVVDERTVVFRTGPGTKLGGIHTSNPVALEVDGYDGAANLAWSVVLRGAAEELARPTDRLAATGLPVFPWQSGPKDHFVRITELNLSGRRFAAVKPDIWAAPANDPRRAVFE
ncbi:pyridoxamine 5'-phosphate oxidase family protein [Pseudarthrobacter sp. P1]|uniref:pyridoxamine 5'-phosphate oxidase family protein n=1 Tax=Pseudarthrobacter sp. P1 TaxID=3418418 RepID=UPI003CF47507